MGSVKHQIDYQNEMHGHAREIVVLSRAAKECENHPGTLIEGLEDTASAYALANSMITRGMIKVKERKDLTDAIKKVLESEVHQVCPDCEKWEKEK